MRRRLDTELVRRGLVASRTRAAEAIAAGRVTVSGGPATTASRQVGADEPIVLLGPAPRFVSRGGEKLEAALERFAVDVSGRRCLDAGASTGGFTDCLLQRGAATVVAVDVGRGQLHGRMRDDPRVVVLERSNIRHLTLDEIDGTPCDVGVADLSFISLLTVAPALASLTTERADLVLLVKPQFEAGRADVGRGGIVRDPSVHRSVLTGVVDGLRERGLVTTDAMPSPLRGADGNVEFVIHCRKVGARVASEVLNAAVAEAHTPDPAPDVVTP